MGDGRGGTSIFPTRRARDMKDIGLYGSNWVDFMENSYELVAELMTLAPNKRKYYQQGERAMRLILFAS